MAASKMILAVVVVASAIALAPQVDARPSTLEDWLEPFDTAFKNLTSKMTDFVGDHSQITENAKTGFNTFVSTLQSEVGSLSKSLESKPGVSDLVKNITQQYQSAVESLTKNLPADLTPEKLTEKYKDTQKTITDHASELWKKVQGNTDLEKDVKEFTKKQTDALVEQYKSYQAKLAELTAPKQ